MRFEAALTEDANLVASNHLLRHFQQHEPQEDLCFALWRPSTGKERLTGLIDRIILPETGERSLHRNASFKPCYLSRAIELARVENAGLAFMHSHPGTGWQGLSHTDVNAERDAIAYPAGATELPLIGMTIGSDGYWSARFWQRESREMRRHWCDKVRIIGPKSYRLQFNDALVPPEPRKDVLKRTYDTWGSEVQNAISRMHVGIVGVGSVGCIVAEAIVRIGVGKVTLIDPDKVERHNLDRLLYGTLHDVGKEKVHLAKERMEQNATASNIRITAIPRPIQERQAYRAALDCDVLFSCVDRPMARDALNYIANAHLIPVFDGGIAVEQNLQRNGFSSAHWRSHVVTPYHQCLRCNRQYNTSMVMMERDGSLDDPSYIRNLPASERPNNQNVFPFSLAAAASMTNMMIRYLIGETWWPEVQQQDYQFVTGETRILNEKCHEYCEFRRLRSRGDGAEPPYIA